MMKKLSYLTLLSAGLLCNPWAASAKTYNVGCSVDELRAAVTELNGLAEDHTVNLTANCTYKLTDQDPNLTPNREGDRFRRRAGVWLKPLNNRTITVNGNNATIKRSQATDTPEFTVMMIRGDGAANNAAVLNELTLEGGKDLYFSWTGGIDIFEKARLNKVTVRNNEGGKIGGINAAAEVEIVDSFIESNEGRSIGGVSGSNITVTRTRIADNLSLDPDGIGSTIGGIAINNYEGETVSKIIDSEIINNRSRILDHSYNSLQVGGAFVAYGEIINSKISGNTADTNDTKGRSIGGVYLISSKLTEGSVVTDNHSDRGVGGVWAIGGEASFPTHISNSTISNNSGSAVGGIRFTGADTHVAAEIRNTLIEGNTANQAGNAGGLFAEKETLELQVSDTVIRNNRSTTQGGGMVVEDGAKARLTRVKILNNEQKMPDTFEFNFITGIGGVGCKRSELTVNDSQISGNTAYALTGGGIGAYYCDLTVNNSLIADNKVFKFNIPTPSVYIEFLGGDVETGSGGGIGGGYSNITINNSSVINNEAETSGGGIGLTGSNNKQVTISGTTISGNKAGVRGGGIGNALGKKEGSTTTDNSGLTLTSTTISNNTAPQGSGIDVGDFNLEGGVSKGQVTLDKTIVAGNQGADCYLGEGDILGNTNSLLQTDSDGSNACDTGSQTFAIRGDAKLHPLGSYDGHTYVHLPMPDSPAINLGIGATKYVAGQQPPPPLVTSPIIFKDSFEAPR